MLHCDLHNYRQLWGHLLMRQPFLSGTSPDGLSGRQISPLQETQQREEDRGDALVQLKRKIRLTFVITDSLPTTDEDNNKDQFLVNRSYLSHSKRLVSNVLVCFYFSCPDSLLPGLLLLLRDSEVFPGYMRYVQESNFYWVPGGGQLFQHLKSAQYMKVFTFQRDIEQTEIWVNSCL